MTFNWMIFGYGVLGGAFGELLKWYQLRESPSSPAYLGNLKYWILTVLMALAGGLLAALQNVSSPLLAINIGISAPLILKALAAVTPIQLPQAEAPVQPPQADVVIPLSPATLEAQPSKSEVTTQPGARLIDMIAGR